MPTEDVHSTSPLAGHDSAQRRREFLKLAGGAAALGGAGTVLASSPANADVEDDLAAHIADVVTVDGLPHADLPLVGGEVLHGIQEGEDVQFTVAELVASGVITPANLAHTFVAMGAADHTWAGATHVLGSDDVTERTLTLPHHDFGSANTHAPLVRVLQMGAAKIRLVAGTDAVVVSKASGVPASVRTSVRYGGVSAEAVANYGNTTVWLVTGDIEAY